MKIEIFTSSDGLDLVANTGDTYRVITENDSVVRLISKLIEKSYPKADHRLKAKYSDEFSRVRRFCKCNFSKKDNIPDIDNRQFNFEYVDCPLRGECEDENIICNPTFDSGLTLRETQIVKEFAKGLQAKEVGYSLRITTRTAETHRRNIYAKLGINNTGELVNWAHNHNLTVN
mgnify:CR=1 FL=1